MTTSTKAVKWSVETTENLVTAYAETKDVKAVAKALNRTEAAVRGKLVSLGVYESAKKATATSKTATASKADLVDALAKELGLLADGLRSLENARRETLQEVLDAVQLINDFERGDVE